MSDLGRVEFTGRRRNRKEIDYTDPLNDFNKKLTNGYDVPYKN